MLATAIVVFVLFRLLVVEPMMQSVLVSSFETNSERWTRYLAAQIEGFGLDTSGDDVETQTSSGDPTDRYDNFASTLQAALAAGSILQADIFKTDCDCIVSVLAPEPGDDPTPEDEQRALQDILEAMRLLAEHEISGQFVLGDRSRAVQLPTAQGQRDETDHTVLRLEDADAGEVWLGVTTVSSHALTGSVKPERAESADHRHNSHRAAAATNDEVHDEARHALVIRLIEDVTPTASKAALALWVLSAVAPALSAFAVCMSTRLLRRSRRTGEMSEQQARFLADHDSLTGLLNRRGFQTRAEAMLDRASREGKRVCLAQIDLDKFKDINDLHGHATGDEMLLAVSGMIRRIFPEDALAARLGGDEFAVFILEGQVASGCENFLEEVDTSVVATMNIDGVHHTLMATTSIGYAFYPRDGKSLFELMKASDLALYNVKREGRNATGRYHPNLGRAFERRIWEIDGIRMAAQTGHIQPHYQPLVNAQTMEIEGFESLVRWKHPTLGLLTPTRFANALRDPAACRAVTGAMLEMITDDLARWRAAGHGFSVGLNVTEADLKCGTFVDDVVAVLDRKAIPHRSLAIEVTEQSANRFNVDVLKAQLDRFRDRGMFIALDDFGTDGSSITMLKNLPCTALKIDKSFVSGMTTDMDDLSIVRALIDLGHDLGLKIVAEGVETEHQLNLLVEVGADLLQGYHFGNPMEASVIDEMLTNWPVARIVATHAA